MTILGYEKNASVLGKEMFFVMISYGTSTYCWGDILIFLCLDLIFIFI